MATVSTRFHVDLGMMAAGKRERCARASSDSFRAMCLTENGMTDNLVVMVPSRGQMGLFSRDNSATPIPMDRFIYDSQSATASYPPPSQ